MPTTTSPALGPHSRKTWNHNIHYHDTILRSVPARCRRALDVGCGQGLLARRLARSCEEVIALDLDPACIARASSGSHTGITFLAGDVMCEPLPAASFDLITAVATLHHLPLRPALARFRDLLRPGGVLAVLGLYRAHTLADFVSAAAAFPVSRVLRRLHPYEEVAAPLHTPRETLNEIRSACKAVLPGAILRRHLLFRYSLVWHKAGGD